MMNDEPEPVEDSYNLRNVIDDSYEWVAYQIDESENYGFTKGLIGGQATYLDALGFMGEGLYEIGKSITDKEHYAFLSGERLYTLGGKLTQDRGKHLAETGDIGRYIGWFCGFSVPLILMGSLEEATGVKYLDSYITLGMTSMDVMNYFLRDKNTGSEELEEVEEELEPDKDA